MRAIPLFPQHWLLARIASLSNLRANFRTNEGEFSTHRRQSRDDIESPPCAGMSAIEIIFAASRKQASPATKLEVSVAPKPEDGTAPQQVRFTWSADLWSGRVPSLHLTEKPENAFLIVS
jgi:hypothetical protein